MRICFLIVGLAVLLVPAPTLYATELSLDPTHGPLRVRNMSPVLTLYGVPRMTGAHILKDDLEITFNVEIANNFQSKLTDDSFAFFDGESYIASYRFRKDFADHWEWGVELPWVVHTPGEFDPLIDGFHELFDLPDGNRPVAERNRLDYLIRADGVVYADFDESRSGIGDVRAFLGRQIFKNDNSALAVRGMLKAATGEVESLTGSGGTDVGVWAEYERSFHLGSLPMRMSGGVGFSYLGQGDLLPDDQRHWMSVGHFGLQMQFKPWFEFHAQADAHSRTLENDNQLIADGGILGTLGARFALTNKLWLDMVIVEDLRNDSASDVIFQFLLGARLD